MIQARRIALALGLTALLSGAIESVSAEKEGSNQNAPVLVAIGDSITAGFANATLVEETQRLSYPALIAAQMQIPFGQPYISTPGLPAMGFRFDRRTNVLEMPYLSLRSAKRLDPSN